MTRNSQQKRLVIYGAHGRRVQADGGKAGYLSRQVAIFKKQMLAKGDWQQAKGLLPVYRGDANRLLPTVNHGISIRSLMSFWVGQLRTAGPKSEEKPLQG